MSTRSVVAAVADVLLAISLALITADCGTNSLRVADLGDYRYFLEGTIPVRKPSYKSNGHRVSMGSTDPECDDAQTDLHVDFDGNPVMYTCQEYEQPVPVNRTGIEEPVWCLQIPKSFEPNHHCMNDRIVYYQRLPTFQGHRPNWAIFGEYTYVPPPRYMHNIEHGTVVFLYHPCSDPEEVDQFRRVIKGCLRKHVITASRRVTAKHPFALLAWGCSLEMESFDEAAVVEFVRRFALHGPEGHYPKEGRYNYMLLEQAVPPPGSDMNDTVLCPGY